MGNDQPCKIEGVGSVKICMFDGVNRTLTHVRFIPNMIKNLISLGVLDVKSSDKNVILKGYKHNNLYLLECTTIWGEVNFTRCRREMSHLWHSRLGHMSDRYLSLLDDKKMLPGLGTLDFAYCEHYIMGKQHRRAFSVGTHDSKEILKYVHIDVWVPSPTASLSGKLYYVFIDDYSRYVWVYFLTHKSEVFSTFKTWRIQVENQTGNRVKYLRSNNDGEYTSEEFQRYCTEEEITRHFTKVYTPEQNAISKRLNKTVLEKVRSMLSESGLPREFWAEAVNTAVYLIKLSHSSAIQFSTPFELMHKRMADYSRLKGFGCIAYPLTPKEHRTK